MSMSQVNQYRSQMTPDSLWPAARNAEEAERALSKVTHPTANVLTWESNDRQPMDDMLAAWLVLGYITEAQAAATTEARDQATAEFLSAYRANPPQPSAEDLAEMRATFGPGARVVNVVTDKKYQL